MALFSPHTPPATGRSKTVRTPDDGIGPSVDEFFTLSLGGMVTLLNTSSASIFAGDLVEWTLSYDKAAMSNAKRARHGPRRIGIQTATVSSPKVIGRALSFAKPVRCRPQNCLPPSLPLTNTHNSQPLLVLTGRAA